MSESGGKNVGKFLRCKNVGKFSQITKIPENIFPTFLRPGFSYFKQKCNPDFLQFRSVGGVEDHFSEKRARVIQFIRNGPEVRYSEFYTDYTNGKISISG